MVREGNTEVTFKQMTGSEREAIRLVEELSGQVEEQVEKEEFKQGNQLAGAK